MLAGGHTIAHSLFVAFPFLAVLVAITRRTGIEAPATAFVVGYVSHLFGDVVYLWLVGDPTPLAFLVWPVYGTTRVTPTLVLDRVASLLVEFLHFLGTRRGRLYLLGELALLAGTPAPWVLDGRPGSSRNVN